MISIYTIYNKAALRQPRRHIHYITLLALLAVVPLMSGCGAWEGFKSIFSAQPQDAAVTGTDMEMTREAMNFFNSGRYMMAEEIFQKIRDRYPFSPYATVAELRLADCKFYRGLYEEAIPLYQNFEQLHPTNEAIPYVIFQEGACYYELMDTPDRDQTNTIKMIDTYRRLVDRFPESAFTYEAKKRIREGNNLLAEHEYVVAEWYARVDRPDCAINRLERLLSLYPDTDISSEAEALLREQRQIARENAKQSTEIPELPPWYERLWPF